MTIETFPLIVGALIALFGLALVLDARLPDSAPRIERRRRVRRERSRGGELLIGLGVTALGIAVAGRDSWRYSILAMVVGASLIVLGAWANRSYLRELLTTRGASRRRDAGQRDRPAPGSPGSPEAPGASEDRPRVR